MRKEALRKGLTLFSILLFVGCISFLVYYLGIQPYMSKQVQNKYKDIYYSSNLNVDLEETSIGVPSTHSDIDNAEEQTTSNSLELDNNVEPGKKNSEGVLVKFEKLQNYNEDIIGWLNIPGTIMDYPVMQSTKDPDYYLTRDFEKNKDKNGSLYLDEACNIKSPSKNFIIHGHNMKSTGMMFHELINYKNLSYYKEHPIIIFDTLYEESQWKIIGFIRTSGDFRAQGAFDYLKGEFTDSKDFLNFIYEIRLRSSYYCPVEINENDSLLMLSTCTYEINDYRAVVIARKLRPDESATVDTSLAFERSDVLYPAKWYSQYSGDAPTITDFNDAMTYDEIDWYDGDILVESVIGDTLEYGDGKYEITSGNTIKFLKPISKELTKITIPTDVTIDKRTFKVTEISDNAFKKAKALESIKIGNNITDIPSEAFSNCVNLSSVNLGDGIETIGKDAFSNISENATIIMPEDKFKKYSKMIKKSNVGKSMILKKK